MAIFRYRAIRASGPVIEGELEALDRQAAILLLRDQGLLPVRAEPISGPRWSLLGTGIFRRNRVTRLDVELLLRELAMLLGAGIALDRALKVIGEHAEALPVRFLVSGIVEHVSSGQSLAEAMARENKAFDRLTIGMVRACEVGGALETALSRIADFMERSRRFRNDLQSTLRYPLVLLFFSIIAIAITITFVIPGFQSVFADAGYELPLVTRAVMAVGNVAQKFWWVGLIIGLIAILAFRLRLRDPAFRFSVDKKLTELPLLGSVITKLETVRFFYTLGMLLKGGLPIANALPIARETIANVAIARSVEHIERLVKEGKPLAEPVAQSGAFPRMATQLLKIGEESGQPEDMIFRIADIYEQELQRQAQHLLSILVPLLTCVMALVIGIIIMSILLPMLSMPDIIF